MTLLLGAFSTPNTSSTTQLSNPTPHNATQHSQHDLIVSFKPHITPAQAKQLVEQHNARVIKNLAPNLGLNIYHITTAQGKSVAQSIQLFTALPKVKYAEPNGRATTM